MINNPKINNLITLIFIRFIFSYLASFCLLFAMTPILFMIFVFDNTLGGEYLSNGLFKLGTLFNLVNNFDDVLDKNDVLWLLSQISLVFFILLESFKWLIRHIVGQSVIVSVRLKILIATICIISVHILGAISFSVLDFTNDNESGKYLILVVFCLISLISMLGYYVSHMVKEFFLRLFSGEISLFVRKSLSRTPENLLK